MFGFEHLIDKSVLNVDTAGVCALQIAQEFFKWRRFLKRILGEDREELFGFGTYPEAVSRRASF